MTRISKKRSTSDHLSAPPPLDMLPTTVRKLLTEYHDLTERHGAAASEWATLRLNRRADDAEAVRLDGAAAATAALQGKSISGTPNRDALDARRRDTEQRTAALSDAVENVRLDLLNAVLDHRESKAASAALDAARQNLRETGEAFRVAIRAAGAAMGVHDFLHGQPWDPSAGVAAAELAPHLTASLGPRGADLPAVDAVTAVEAISRLAD